MADQVEVPQELRSRFAQFDAIAATTEQLADLLGRINQANLQAAGRDDETAKAYHKQMDDPTSNLAAVVRQVGELFGITGERGSAAAGVLADSSDTTNETAGQDWGQ